MIAIMNKNPLIRIDYKGTVEVCEDIDVRYNDFRFTVPKGFKCNGASIPRFFYRICGGPTTGSNLLGGIIHDNIYSVKLFDRETCDRIFYEVLIRLHKPKWIAWLMWKAVIVFGKSHY